nr:MAG: hypothetical protein DIU68_02780 [Chloroflexota bacterium]
MFVQFAWEETFAMSDDTGHPHAPFEDFINFSLDMEGVDGISFETVARALRDTIRNLPLERDDESWTDRLDRLQATLHACLNIEVIGRLLRENPRIADMDANELDDIINQTVLLAFISYNELTERFDFETPQVAKAREETRKLWVLLRAASGWINKAASEDDPVAQGMAKDISRALEEIRPYGWVNNTRKL